MISDPIKLTTKTDHYSDLPASAFLVLAVRPVPRTPPFCGAVWYTPGKMAQTGVQATQRLYQRPVTTLGVGDPSVA